MIHFMTIQYGDHIENQYYNSIEDRPTRNIENWSTGRKWEWQSMNYMIAADQLMGVDDISGKFGPSESNYPPLAMPQVYWKACMVPF